MKVKQEEDDTMSVKPSVTREEQIQTQEAWAKLSGRLAQEQASPLWAQWADAQSSLEPDALQAEQPQEQLKPAIAVHGVDRQANVVPLGRMHTKGDDAPQLSAKPQSRSLRWLRRHTGKAIAVCAASLVAIVVATPSANEALAAWLNKFQMNNEIVVVQEDDLQAVWQSLGGYSDSRESVNRFGEFEHEQVGEYDEWTLEQAEANLGFKLPDLSAAGEYNIRTNKQPGSIITLRLNVDEINAAMKKLGAAKLLPQSVDGKKIALVTGSGTAVQYFTSEETDNQHLSVSYLGSPSIEVDPTLEVEEAYEAIMNFPLLPDYLRQSFQQSVDLKNGRVPLPLVVDNAQSEITIGDKTVYIEQYSHNEYVSAIWLQGDMIAQAGFRGFKELSEVQKLLAELVQE